MTKKNSRFGVKPARKRPERRASESFGAAAPVKYIDRAIGNSIKPPTPADPAYLKYASGQRKCGNTPKTLEIWRYRQMKKRARAKTTAKAVIQHRFKPYVPA